jgi:hypothetical protein
MSRPAKSLTKLQQQLDQMYPNRKKPDGLLGDAAHAARKSDHNPNSLGDITAIDISEGGGLPDRHLADRLLASKDPRIKYIISEGRMGRSYNSGGTMPWTWAPYTGANAHSTHVHVSVGIPDHLNPDPYENRKLYDDESDWNLTEVLIPTPLPKPPVDSELHQQMAKKIINYEYKKRPFAIHTTSDGPEIVGIVRSKHPEWYDKVVSHLGNDADLEKSAAEFYITYTNQAEQWTDDLGVQHYVRDLMANRGHAGAATIVQMALGFTGDDLDGVFGPKTKIALSQMPPTEFLNKVTAARAEYDHKKYGYGPGHAYYNGLKNRWTAALADAKLFSALETPAPPVTPPVTPPIQPPITPPVQPPVQPPVTPPVTPPVQPPPVTPPVEPAPFPGAPTPEWFAYISRLSSINLPEVTSDIRNAIKSAEASIKFATEALDEIETKMEIKTPADVHKAIRSGKQASEIAAARGTTLPDTTPEPKGNSMFTSDNVWMLIRYALLVGSGFLAGQNLITQEQAQEVLQHAQNIATGWSTQNWMAVLGSVGALGTLLWGLKAKLGTKAVPADVAARPDVPVVSGATGAVEPATVKKETF